MTKGQKNKKCSYTVQMKDFSFPIGLDQFSRLLDFKNMSTHLQLFYAFYVHINIFCMVSFLLGFFFFLHTVLLNINIFLNRPIWPMDETLTGNATPSQSGPGNKDNGEMTSYFPELAPNHWMQFNIVLRNTVFCWVFLWGVWSYPSAKNRISVLLSPANRVTSI